MMYLTLLNTIKDERKYAIYTLYPPRLLSKVYVGHPVGVKYQLIILIIKNIFEIKRKFHVVKSHDFVTKKRKEKEYACAKAW